MIDAQVTDLLSETARRINAHGVATLADVEAAPPLVGFADPMQAENRVLKAFLREELYRHYQVVRMTTKARRVVRDLFGAFLSDVRLLPPQHQTCAEQEGMPRAIADYIAGMTDRYAMKEHHRLFAIGEF
jgi:dGTPase